MFSAKVAGLELRSIGNYGPITVTHTWPHGFDSATWEMDPALRHSALRGNAPVVMYDGGFPIGYGTLQEPGNDGVMSVVGLWKQGEAAPSLTSAGGFTTVPDSAIDGAIFRGDVTWKRPASLSATAWVTTADGQLTLNRLLDGYLAENGGRWQINNYGDFEFAVDPTVPRWHVPHAVAGRGLTPAEDEFLTHIVGRFITSYSAAGPAYDIVTAPSTGATEASIAFGRRSVQVELDEMGVITSAKALAVVTGMYLRAGARMGWGEGLELSRGQIITPGGEPAPLEQVQAGQMIRLCGVMDPSRANRVPMSIDIVIASSTYTDGSDTISLTPQGYAPRNHQDAMDYLMESA